MSGDAGLTGGIAGGGNFAKISDMYTSLSDFKTIAEQNNGYYIDYIVKGGVSLYGEGMASTPFKKDELHYMGNESGKNQMCMSIKIFKRVESGELVLVGESDKYPIVFVPKDLTKFLKKNPSYKLPEACKGMFPNIPVQAETKEKEVKQKEQKVKKEKVEKEKKPKYQYSSENYNNIVKWRPLALGWKGFDFSYEKVLSAGRSFNLKASYILPSNLINPVSGLYIIPEYRFYLAKRAPDGFYVAPYLKYVYNTYTSYGIKTTQNIYGIGAAVGYQKVLGKRFTLDWNFAGAGVELNQFLVPGTSPVSGFTLGIKTNFSVGYRF